MSVQQVVIPLLLHRPICNASRLTFVCFCLQDFVEGLDGIPDDAKQSLKYLTPATYIGNAAEQAKQIVAQCKAM